MLVAHADAPAGSVIFFLALLLKHIITNERNILIGNGQKGAGFGLTPANFLGQSLPTALFERSARPARPPREERIEIQDGSHACSAWT